MERGSRLSDSPLHRSGEGLGVGLSRGREVGLLMRVGVTHTTRLRYGAHVVEGVMDVRLGPRSDVDQRWQEYDLRATPNAAIRRYYDGFGNAAHLVTIARAHDEVELV